MVPLRINLPGAPPIGVWMDVLVFYWVVMALMVAGHVSGRIAGQRSAWTVVTGAMPLAVVVAVAALYGVSSHYITQIVVAALA